MNANGLRASDRVRRQWAARVHAEYSSAAYTQHLTLWLVQLAVSPDLIRAGLAITDDELTHAELGYAVCCAAGAPEMLQLQREALALPSGEGTLEHDLVRACLRSFCIGETLAVPLFAAMREGCSVAVARAGLDRILRDEVRHRDFGWALLETLMATHEPIVRAVVDAELVGMLAERRRACEQLVARNDPRMTEDELAWGLLDAGAYLGLFERSLERDIRPRLLELDLIDTLGA